MPSYFDGSDEVSKSEWLPLTAEAAKDPNFDTSSSEDELDYVSIVDMTLDTTLDSDEPLPWYIDKIMNRNAPGSANFRWRKKDNFPRKVSFSRDPRLKAALTDKSTPSRSFLSLLLTT